MQPYCHPVGLHSVWSPMLPLAFKILLSIYSLQTKAILELHCVQNRTTFTVHVVETLSYFICELATVVVWAVHNSVKRVTILRKIRIVHAQFIPMQAHACL